MDNLILFFVWVHCNVVYGITLLWSVANLKMSIFCSCRNTRQCLQSLILSVKVEEMLLRHKIIGYHMDNFTSKEMQLAQRNDKFNLQHVNCVQSFKFSNQKIQRRFGLSRKVFMRIEQKLFVVDWQLYEQLGNIVLHNKLIN